MTEPRLLTSHPESKPKRPPKPKVSNPVDTATQAWLESLPADILDLVPSEIQIPNVSGAPKRWVVYHPMVLLPSGSFEQIWWKSLFVSVPQHIDSLWRTVLEHIGKREGKGLLTHLAINAGIPLNKTDNEDDNVLRTPSGLLTLFGDFGPPLDPTQSPSDRNFQEAFWVSTKQNGITQIWAPRYTMFSRGNIKEKARILDFHNGKATQCKSKSELSKETAVDLYAGIGYFVFSYVKMGMNRVFGWELNPWSVEGLRRGALANGWSVKVVRDGDVLDYEDEDIVVMLEDNMKASGRLETLQQEKGILSISHVNCGLLPSSEASWETALGILSGEGWLHLHENVGVDDIPSRKSEIEDSLQRAPNEKLKQRQVKAEEVELVKTFAPGVWHCVFDIYINSSTT